MPEQAVFERIHLRKHGVIEALAGTGKTYTIQNLVLRILETPGLEHCSKEDSPNIPVRDGRVGIEELLIVTYTEKAAGELRVRIREGLEKRVTQLQIQEQDCSDTEKFSLRNLREHLELCLNNIQLANISTIHGFCKSVLSTYPVESQVAMSQEFSDEDSELLAAFRSLLHELDPAKEEYGTYFSEFLQSKIGEKLSAYLPLAKELEENSDRIQPDEKFFAQLKQDQANTLGKMQDLVSVVLEAQKNLLQALSKVEKELKDASGVKGLLGTIHKMKLSAKGFEEQSQQHKFKETLLQKPQQKGFQTLTEILKKKDGSYSPAGKKCSPKIVDEYTDAFLSYRNTVTVEHPEIFSKLKFYCHRQAEHENLLADKKNYLFLAAFLKKLSRKVKRERKLSGKLSFKDMIDNVAAAVGKKDSSLCALLQKKFRYGIIDESQDTSNQQFSIFQNIFLKNATPKSVLYLIGDPHQSIFAFQGADVSSYIRARDEIYRLTGEKPEAPPYQLLHNFRSSRQLIAAYNHLFQHGDEDWFQKNITGINYSQPAQSGMDISSDAEHFRGPEKILDKAIVTYTGEAGNIDAQRWAYANWCVQEIRKLLPPDADSPVQIRDSSIEGGWRNLTYSDIAFLVESHAKAIPVLRQLRAAGIPCSKYKEDGIFHSEECLHFITLLEAILENGPRHNNTKRALLTPFFGWTPAQVSCADPTDDEYGHFRMLESWRILAQKAQWGRLISAIFSDSLIDLLLPQLEEGPRRLSALRQVSQFFLENIKKKNDDFKAAILQLRNLYSEEQSSGDDNLYNKESESPHVQVMTMHASKGLGFPVVFVLPGDGKLHHHLCYRILLGQKEGKEFWLDAAHLGTREQEAAEKLRLYYVTCTRAGFRLFLPIWMKKATKTKDERAQGTLSVCTEKASKAHADCSEKETCIYSSKINCSSSKQRCPLYTELGNLKSWKKAPKEIDRKKEWRNPEDLQNSLEKAKKSIPKIPDFLKRQQRQTSYSQLVHHKKSNPLAQRDDQTDGETGSQNSAESLSLPESFLPRNNTTGNALHEVLELCNFQQAATPDQSNEKDEEILLEILRAKMQKNGIWSTDPLLQVAREKEARELIYNTMLAKIELSKKHVFSLGTLKPTNYQTEAEFHFAFDRDGRPFPSPKEDTSGWVKGYIDLLFRVPAPDGGFCYHALDWKTNSLLNYDFASLDQAMEDQGYKQQAMLYTLALHRFLQQSLGETYDAKIHLGLPVYAFLRGTRPNSNSGIWIAQGEERELFNNMTALEKRVKDQIRSSFSIRQILNPETSP